MNRLLYTLLLVLLMGTLTGCGTFGSLQKNAEGSMIPSRPEIEQHFKGRAFKLGTVTTRITEESSKKFHPLPDWAYEKLLKDQLEKAFSASGILNGTQPAYVVDVEINKGQFAGTFWEASIFRTTTIVSDSDSVRARFMLETHNGTAIYTLNSDTCPAMRMRQQIPGMAANIAQGLEGLQNGVPLDDTVNTLTSLVPFEFIGTGRFSGVDLGEGLYGMDWLNDVDYVREVTGLPLEGCS